MGAFPERHYDAVRMDLGYLAVGALRGDNFVGDAEARGIGPRSGLVWIRDVVGIGANVESRTRRAAAIFARMGRLPQQAALPRSRQKPSAMETRSVGGRHCRSVLRTLDDPHLRRFSSIFPAAFKPAVPIVAREQRHFR